MPGFIACKLCPELIFVPTDFKKYTHYSDLTRKGQILYFFGDSIIPYVKYVIMCPFKSVFHEYDPNFTAASLDEAYLDITQVCRERDITGGEVSYILTYAHINNENVIANSLFIIVLYLLRWLKSLDKMCSKLLA